MSVYSSNAAVKRVRAKHFSEVPKTRSELHCWLTGNLSGGKSWDVFKEGPYYAVRVGTKICATGLRSLANATFGWWRDFILFHSKEE